MNPPGPARKVSTVVKAALLATLFVFCGVKVVLISGTKANTTFVNVSTGAPTAAATTKTTAAPATTGTASPAKTTATPTARP